MFTEQLRADTAQWLAKTIGDWAGFMIQDKAEYLGVALGPAATEHDYWRAAAAKWFARVLELAKCNATTFLSTKLYNERVLPVLGYLQQLRPT